MSFKAQGIMTGKLARRVLNGEKPENIPIVNEGTDFYMFDWRQLQQWGIREKDLPPASVVRFKEPSLWEAHHVALVGISAAFCLLALLIMVLLINLERRRRAERELAGLNEELEQRVKERTADLEFANRELEAFSFSVSHDLKAPLRAIEGFSRMLAGEHAIRLDEEGLRLLDVICNNTQIMSKLINDLLALSRLGRQQIKKSSVNLNALAGQVFKLLHDTEPEREVQLTVQPDLPPGWGDPSLLNQVMMNLVGNAIKYTKTKKTAIIEVGGSIQGQETIYYVKDNGVGFEARYADKLFGLFQRLHGGPEYEGTGVGLAIVQRIIQRHGGRVWAEGKLNEGAIFYFALPKKGA